MRSCLEIDVAGAHDGGRIAIVDQRQQQMLERRKFVVALVGVLERAMQRGFPGSSRSDGKVDLLFLHGALQRMAVLA